MWVLSKLFPSEHERYSRLKEQDATLAFAERALANGDWAAFDDSLAKVLKEFSDKEKKRKIFFLILRQTTELAVRGINTLLEKDQMAEALALLDTFQLAQIDVLGIGDVSGLQEKAKQILKGYLLDTSAGTPILGGAFDKERAKHDVIAVFAIRQKFRIPLSFFEEQEIYPLVCKKVAAEINRYFWYKDMENNTAPLMALAGVSQPKIPEIPERILQSPEVQTAIENRLKQYIQESDIDKAKGFAKTFHYGRLNALIAAA